MLAENLLVTANVAPRLPMLFNLMMEVIRFFETRVLTRARWRHIPEDEILQNRLSSTVVKNLDGSSIVFIETFLSLVRSQVFTAVTMKNDVFWDVRPCGSCKNRSFGAA
jgi:hypothetical protein